MSDRSGLVCAYLRTPGGRWCEVGWPEIDAWAPGAGLLWVHLSRDEAGAADYLATCKDIDPIVSEALLADETRPRAVPVDDGLLLNLRGVNLNPGADPEDMVSLRLWIESERIITTRLRRIVAIDDLRQRLASGRGPESSADFLVQIASRLVDRMSTVIEDLDEQTDSLEADVVDQHDRVLRTELVRTRRQSIALRRYLAPQRDALARLQTAEFPWLEARPRARLREIADRVVRYVEDLDEVRERAAVIQDELVSRHSDQMNRNMYLLTIVATIMLPLGFITGLLGINVDGIPGSSDTPWAFAVVCGLMTVLVAVEVLVLRRLRWF